MYREFIAKELLRVACLLVGKRSTPKQRKQKKKYYREHKQEIKKKKKKFRKRHPAKKRGRPGGVSGKKRRKSLDRTGARRIAFRIGQIDRVSEAVGAINDLADRSFEMAKSYKKHANPEMAAYWSDLYDLFVDILPLARGIQKSMPY